MNRNLKYFILTAVLFLSGLLYSCQDKMEFEQSGWRQKNDIGDYVYRERMLSDLIENYKIKGLSNKELKYLLGEPDKYLDYDSNSFCYNIVVSYKSNIDPSFVKNLIINFNVDSIVSDFNVDEYKR